MYERDTHTIDLARKSVLFHMIGHSPMVDIARTLSLQSHQRVLKVCFKMVEKSEKAATCTNMSVPNRKLETDHPHASL